MSTYKLHYFDSPGYGEPIRIIFAQAGVKFEDVRYSREQWSNEKQKMPFGRMPVLEVDGIKIAGSLNILRYLGVKFGMAGKDEVANGVLGGASDNIHDIGNIFMKMYAAPNDEERGKIAQEFKEKSGPPMLKTLQKHVKNGHINGSETLSWVDIQCYYFLDNLSQHLKINIGDYPELQKLYDNVASQPNIKNWLENRPKTEH